jgi:hypothetical protein
VTDSNWEGEAPLPKIIKKYRRERDTGSSDVLSSDWWIIGLTPKQQNFWKIKKN